MGFVIFLLTVDAKQGSVRTKWIGTYEIKRRAFVIGVGAMDVRHFLYLLEYL